MSQLSSADQLSLLDCTDEARCYHNPRYGFFTLLLDRKTGKRQRAFKLDDMHRVLPLVDRTRDSWISQAEFILPNRRIVNLARIGLLFCDLDYYRTDYKRLPPERVAEALIWYCHNEANIPPPSLIIFSGRGLQAKWLLDGTVPRQALPRWNACQRKIIDTLDAFGADPAAKDASRVLRLVNTVNNKTGEVCRVIHITEGKDGEPVRYNFELLCENLLPLGRWDIEKHRAERKLKQVIGNKAKAHQRLQGNRIAWDRLEDLRKLTRLRGGVPEGERMTTLFWQLNFLLLSGATSASQMFHEAAALAKEIDPRWGYRTAELSTLYNKAKAYNAGERIEFNGREYPALYTPKNDTLINTFNITDAEQQQLQTIISRTEKARRRAIADKKNKGWKMSREEYRGQAQEKRSQAIELRSKGVSLRVIAKTLNVSLGAVQHYLR
ncbi:MAG: replication protein [Candidatus Thiodiazotropha endolucinida]|nr:replication protein [Candidatus Thiodiazotropha taylori]MCW4297079.1 replication protein [Candidatus Thiodiazotropha endolucinida]